jgi:hypothetical protein
MPIFVQANASPTGLAVRFAPCRPEFEPPRGQICWPEEAQFICALKKIPSSALRQSTGLRPAQFHGSCDAAVYGWDRGSGVFLDLREKVFFLSTVLEVVLPPRVEFFMPIFELFILYLVDGLNLILEFIESHCKIYNCYQITKIDLSNCI